MPVMSVQRTVINQWLKKNSTTAEHLARRAGINPTSLYRFLNGNTDDMRLGTARAISHATDYELDVCDILGITPRIVYKAAPISTGDSQKCKQCDEPYYRDVSARGVNTPSYAVGRVSTEKVLKKTKAKSSGELLSALAVLEHWTKSFDKQKARVKLSPKRQRSVTKAIAAGWSLEDIKLSITGHSQNPWRHEEPARNELATLLRPENIEAGLELVQPERPKTQETDDSWVFAQAKSERG